VGITFAGHITCSAMSFNVAAFISTKNSFTLCPSFDLKAFERELLYNISPSRGSFIICPGAYNPIYSASNSSCVKLHLYNAVRQFVSFRFHFFLMKSISSSQSLTSVYDISNDSGFRLKHLGVPDGSDGSGGTSYALTENQTRPVAQATGRVAYLPCGGYYTMPHIPAARRVVYYARRSGVRIPLLCVGNVVTYTHHLNDTYVTLFAGVAVM
jgi:hypothetical protein